MQRFIADDLTSANRPRPDGNVVDSLVWVFRVVMMVTAQKPVAPRAKNLLLMERPFVKSWSWRRPIDTFSPVRIS